MVWKRGFSRRGNDVREGLWFVLLHLLVSDLAFKDRMGCIKRRRAPSQFHRVNFILCCVLCVCAWVHEAFCLRRRTTQPSIVPVKITQDGKSLASSPRLSEAKADTRRPADGGVSELGAKWPNPRNAIGLPDPAPQRLIRKVWDTNQLPFRG